MIQLSLCVVWCLLSIILLLAVLSIVSFQRLNNSILMVEWIHHLSRLISRITKLLPPLHYTCTFIQSASFRFLWTTVGGWLIWWFGPSISLCPFFASSSGGETILLTFTLSTVNHARLTDLQLQVHFWFSRRSVKNELSTKTQSWFMKLKSLKFGYLDLSNFVKIATKYCETHQNMSASFKPKFKLYSFLGQTPPAHFKRMVIKT